MKVLVVYSSRTGKTSGVSNQLSKAIGAEKYQIGYIKSGMHSSTKKLTPIGEFKGNLKTFDLVVFASPVWAGTISSPVRTFADRYKKDIKEFAVITTHMSPKDQYQKAEADLEEVIGKKSKGFGSVCTSKGEQQEEQDLGCFIGHLRDLEKSFKYIS
jgi:menaquinone-dependent protoporphyrinogen IX oxidase